MGDRGFLVGHDGTIALCRWVKLKLRHASGPSRSSFQFLIRSELQKYHLFSVWLAFCTGFFIVSFTVGVVLSVLSKCPVNLRCHPILIVIREQWRIQGREEGEGDCFLPPG